MYLNSQGFVSVDTSIYEGSYYPHVADLITHPLNSCNCSDYIVKDSPENVESWRETQKKEMSKQLYESLYPNHKK